MGTKNVHKQIKKVLSSFPLKYSDDITLYLLDNNVEVKYDDKLRYRKYFIRVIDNDEYKYFVDYHHVKSTVGKYKKPNRFFHNNPYTYDNINLFCKNNNIDLCVNGDELPLYGYAREKLDMIDSSGDIHKVSWNQLQHYTYLYKDGYDEIKKTNFKESHMTKEKAIPIIIKKYEELKRPLLQRDFEGVKTTESTIGIRVIWRIWGTFTNMIKDLGLPEHDFFYKPYDTNFMPHNKIIYGIHKVIINVKQSGRTTLMYSDFTDVNISTIKRHCELDGTTLNSIIKSYGCTMQFSGNGLNHIFPDGERVVSKYEYDFSNFLRRNGFIYGQTYFRNIYYKKIDDKYQGNMNCDYLLYIDDNKVYIELAGLLGNKEHINAYRNNVTIKSKSKEEYKNKLYLKRDIFERNGLKYHILLKDEMNEDNYKKLLEKYKNEVA